jgi:hypothetical protein
VSERHRENYIHTYMSLTSIHTRTHTHTHTHTHSRTGECGGEGFVVVTAASSDYFERARNLVGSVHVWQVNLI